jgi:hypothetical protein
LIGSPPVTYGVIHFSAEFPVVATACGVLGPSAARWRYVTCLECLARAPSDPRIERRRQQLLDEQRRRERPEAFDDEV